MKAQNIEAIRKQFHREWLLVAVDRIDESTTIPISGKLVFHSPHRDEIYEKLMNFKRKNPVLVTYSEDSLPKGYAAAF